MLIIRDLTIKLLIISLSYPQVKSASNHARAGGALHHSSHSSQGRGWRWRALSAGGGVEFELLGLQEICSDHWPKKAYFRRFAAT
jgi:hypothetical protein